MFSLLMASTTALYENMTISCSRLLTVIRSEDLFKIVSELRARQSLSIQRSTRACALDIMLCIL